MRDLLFWLGNLCCTLRFGGCTFAYCAYLFSSCCACYGYEYPFIGEFLCCCTLIFKCCAFRIMFKFPLFSFFGYSDDFFNAPEFVHFKDHTLLIRAIYPNLFNCFMHWLIWFCNYHLFRGCNLLNFHLSPFTYFLVTD